MFKNKEKKDISIVYKTMVYFVSFSLGIIFLLTIFTSILFEPFFINNEKEKITKMAIEIEKLYEDDRGYVSKYYDFTNKAYKYQTSFVLIEENGQFFIHDSLGMDKSLFYTNENELNSIFCYNITKNIKNNGDIYFERQKILSSDEDYLIYGFKLNKFDVIVIGNITLKDTADIVDTLRNQINIVSIIILIISLIVSVFLANIYIKPILQITRASEKLGNGQFDINIPKYDIKEINELANTITLASKEIKEIDKIKNEVVQNVAHDIRTPLTMIQAYSEMVKDFSWQDEIKRNEHLDIIIDETKNLNDFVNKTLDLSKLENHSHKFEFKYQDLSTLINDTIIRFNDLVKDKKIKIKNKCEPELVCYMDEQAIKEVLNNFISNAIVHIGKDNIIIVKARLISRDEIKIEISDHGEGIDEEMLPHIWDRYVKSNKQYKRSVQNHGLGLAINKAILEAHNSNYGVISEINKGTTFYFTLKAKNDGDI